MKLPDTNNDQSTNPIGVDMPGDGSQISEEMGAFADDTSKSSGHSGVILGALVVVSGALLWGMHHLGTRGSINLVEISIDYPMGDESETADHTLVIKALRESNEIPQVAPSMIAMNPFTWKAGPTETVHETTEAERLAEEARREHAAKMRQLDTTAKNLVLNSVMRGRVPVANISGELVRVGDRVRDTFVVTRIEGREVDIQAEGRTWTLGVGD